MIETMEYNGRASIFGVERPVMQIAFLPGSF
jgi:hypothetical protein